MKTKKDVLIPIILCLLVFGGILAVATFFDLEISHILTSRALAEGHYNTNDFYGAFMEVNGSSPTCLFLALAFHILFHYGKNNFTGAKQYITMGLMAVLSTVAYFVLVKDMLKYIKRIMVMVRPTFGLAEGNYLTLTFLAVACTLTVLGILATNNIKAETVNKLFRFAVACILIALIPTILVNLVFKSPIGRIRYRAMNMYPDDPVYGFAAFSRWYEWKGQWLDKSTMMHLWRTTDVLKSCPSGHTASAGCTYCLIMLNDALGIKNKKVRALLWIIPICFTAAVALGRIIVGAHFLSDVLFGGSLSFGVMILVREIIICKGSNVKLLLGKGN